MGRSTDGTGPSPAYGPVVAHVTERKERITQATQQQTFKGPRSAVPVLIFGVVFATGTIVGMALSTWAPAISIQTLSTPAGDRSYDAIEDARATRGASISTGDGSYDAVEHARALQQLH